MSNPRELPATPLNHIHPSLVYKLKARIPAPQKLNFQRAEIQEKTRYLRK